MTVDRSRRRLVGALAILVVMALAGCGSASTTTSAGTGPVLARTGDLEIVRAYLPDPASPSVAAVYLTVRDVGSSADQLLSVSTPDAAASTLMTEDDAGSTGTMAPLAAVTIPAHGEASLAPGHDHAMLERPTALAVGQRVPVTLRFARAGSVTVQVPVVPLSAIIGGQGGGSGSMGAMSGTGGG